MNTTFKTGLRASGRLTREPCGCAHDGARWIEMCEQHMRECEALHASALASRARLRHDDTHKPNER